MQVEFKAGILLKGLTSVLLIVLGVLLIRSAAPDQLKSDEGTWIILGGILFFILINGLCLIYLLRIYRALAKKEYAQNEYTEQLLDAASYQADEGNERTTAALSRLRPLKFWIVPLVILQILFCLLTSFIFNWEKSLEETVMFLMALYLVAEIIGGVVMLLVMRR